MANVTVPGYEWTVQASLIKKRGSSAVLIGKTKATLDNDGYVRFTNLGISVAEPNIIIQYSFNVPVGVDKYALLKCFFNESKLNCNFIFDSQLHRVKS